MEFNVWNGGLLTAFLLFQFVAIPGLLLKKNDLADVLWGPAFPLSAIGAAWFAQVDFATMDLRKALVITLMSVWAIRLFFHVGWRNLSHLQEDVRYNNWRKQWGKTAVWRSYLQVWVLQPLILYLFLVPALFVLSKDEVPLGPIGALGLVAWLIGFFFEAVGDEQLRQFKKKPTSKGKLMTSGIWSWTRHPNYFGEVLLWWGFWLLTLEISGAWWTVIGPLGVTYLLTKVSGVDMLEALMKSRPGYSEYAAQTSVFFPWPPKKK